MRTRVRKGQRGLSLIEVTIMLLVLMLLTSVLAPSIFDFVQDAQWVKVKEDCEVLAISVARLIKDVGPQLYGVGANPPRADYPGNKLDLIVSAGTAALGNPLPNLAQPLFLTNWWSTGTNAYNPFTVNGGNSVATCEEQFITNRDVTGGSAPPLAGTGNNLPFYVEALGPPVGLTWGQGWRGAYLSPPCGPDPWGRAYQINVKWVTTSFHGQALPVDHCEDVFCISPGKDGIIDTPFSRGVWGAFWGGPGGLIRLPTSDDWVTIISPCDP